MNQQKGFLGQLNRVIPWEEFRPILAKTRNKPRRSRAGRKPYDLIVMLKCLILQQLHSGDELWGDSAYRSEKVEEVLKLLKFNIGR